MKKPTRSDWSGTKPREKMGDGILRCGVFKNMKMKKVYLTSCCRDCKYFTRITKYRYLCIYLDTVIDSRYIPVSANKCPIYKRKWYKFWA